MVESSMSAAAAAVWQANPETTYVPNNDIGCDPTKTKLPSPLYPPGMLRSPLLGIGGHLWDPRICPPHGRADLSWSASNEREPAVGFVVSQLKCPPRREGRNLRRSAPLSPPS